MKRQTKKDSGMYTFLESTGILSHGGSDEDFKRLKKQYWSEYRRLWKKNKRQQSKSFEIMFTPEEAKIILSQATKHRISPTSYIKLCSLFEKQDIISPVIKGEIRQLWFQHYNTLQHLIDNSIISKEFGQTILNQIAGIEKKILETFIH